MTGQAPRVRFAPSPTGPLHIGSVRVAIFNYLFARHHQGTYCVRVEDTDPERSKQEHTDAIVSALDWLDLNPDEPIVIQSQRFDQHAKIIEQLLEQGKAYRCFCTAQEVADRFAEKTGNAGLAYSKYDEQCRALQGNIDTSKPHVIRFALPKNIQDISFDDVIRGTVTFSIDQLDDFIIARSDGRPMYNFVVVVDDAFMKISHVIRGEDHISNTPKQILLYQACGFSVPQFAHLPLILGPSGEKLSKRDAATSVLDYKSIGYLPDALVNYLVRLGWAHGDQEVFSRAELIEFFTLAAVGKKGSIFDTDKLDWLNGVYLREASDAALLDTIVRDVRPTFLEDVSSFAPDTLVALIGLYKERVKTLKELADDLEQLDLGPCEYPADACAKWVTSDTQSNVQLLIQRLEELPEFTVDLIKQTTKDLCKRLDIKLVQLAQPIRLALIGSTASPGVFEILALLGKEKSSQRLQAFCSFLGESKPA